MLNSSNTELGMEQMLIKCSSNNQVNDTDNSCFSYRDTIFWCKEEQQIKELKVI